MQENKKKRTNSPQSGSLELTVGRNGTLRYRGKDMSVSEKRGGNNSAIRVVPRVYRVSYMFKRRGIFYILATNQTKRVK